jgi:UDP-N-acetylmuramyl pentapeptide phosphotransferase/UDP-N-acetylglucosamine-1-phosphate transferase
VSPQWLLVLILPAAIAWAVIAMLRRSRWAARLADEPNERSLHAAPVPRLGGLGVMAGALPVAACVVSAPLAAIVACAFALTLVSLADDARSLPIPVRLPAHIAAATIAILAFASPQSNQAGLGWIEACVAIGALVWMTNLFNFMDGSDGLAGGMAAIGFAALAFAAAAAGATPLALVAAALASASAGFLPHNFPPARVFLGDAGSVPLGFLAGALGLHGALLGAWPIWFPLLVFSPFIVDATVTILRRLLRGERIWLAHRGHYYQRLVLGGWTRRRLALSGYALMAAAAASALAGRAAGPMLQCGIVFAWMVVYLLLLLVIERRLRRP